MNEHLITIAGTVGGDVDLRFTPTGLAVATFSVAVTPRKKEDDKWVDGETNWYRVTAWRQLAEHAADSIAKGTRVIVEGRLVVRKYKKEGEDLERTSVEITADDIGISIKFDPAESKRAVRSTPSGSTQPDSGWAGDNSEPF